MVQLHGARTKQGQDGSKDPAKWAEENNPQFSDPFPRSSPTALTPGVMHTSSSQDVGLTPAVFFPTNTLFSS